MRKRLFLLLIILSITLFLHFFKTTAKAQQINTQKKTFVAAPRTSSGNIETNNKTNKSDQYNKTIKYDDASLHYKRGVTSYKSGMYNEAIAAFNEAVIMRPDYADAHYNLGVTYNTSGMYEEAIQAYKQAIKIKPDYTQAHYNLGVTYNTSGMYEEAIQAYKQAIKIKPDYTDAHYNLCVSYLKLEDIDSAFEEYKILKNFDHQKAANLYNNTILKAFLEKDNKDLIYTIQTGSFNKVLPAKNQYNSIIQGLNGKELDYLRIEKVGEFYSVRLGKFDGYTATKKFLRSINTKLSEALILKAYIKDERIIRLFKSPLLTKK